MCSARSSGRGRSPNGCAASFRPLTEEPALAAHETRDPSRATPGDPVDPLRGLPCGDSTDAVTISADASCPKHYHGDTSAHQGHARPSCGATLAIHFAPTGGPKLHEACHPAPDQSRRVSQAFAQLHIPTGGTTSFSSGFCGGQPAGGE